MNFKLKNKTDKTSAKGANYAIATVTNEHGEDFENVTLFSPASTKAVGEMLVGELTPNDYQGKKGWKLNTVSLIGICFLDAPRFSE